MSSTDENRQHLTTSEWLDVARRVHELCGIAWRVTAVLVKIDGYRDASRRYTVVVSGGADEGPLFRGDASSLPTLLAEAVQACCTPGTTERETDASSALAEALRLADTAVHNEAVLGIHVVQRHDRPFYRLTYMPSARPTLDIDGDDLVSLLSGIDAKAPSPQVP